VGVSFDSEVSPMKGRRGGDCGAEGGDGSAAVILAAAGGGRVFGAYPCHVAPRRRCSCTLPPLPARFHHVGDPNAITNARFRSRLPRPPPPPVHLRRTVHACQLVGGSAPEYRSCRCLRRPPARVHCRGRPATAICLRFFQRGGFPDTM